MNSLRNFNAQVDKHVLIMTRRPTTFKRLLPAPAQGQLWGLTTSLMKGLLEGQQQMAPALACIPRQFHPMLLA